MTATIYKAAALTILLFSEALGALFLLYQFSLSQNYFTPDIGMVLSIFGILLALTYTFSLTVGVWHTNAHFLMIPFAISLAIFIVFGSLNFYYGLLGFCIAYVFLTYDVWIATQVSQDLVRFNPKIILGTSTKGILFIFALCAGAFIMLNPEAASRFDIAETIAEIADTQYKSIAANDQSLSFLSGNGFLNLNIKDFVEARVNMFVKPYQSYIVPLLAIATLGFIYFINSVVYLVFALTSGGFFYLAKKSGFLKSEFKQVEKEFLTF